MDPLQEGRYRHSILAMRREFAVNTKVQCESYGKDPSRGPETLGRLPMLHISATARRIDPDPGLISLKSITPALNSVLSRSDDQTQFEYQG